MVRFSILCKRQLKQPAFLLLCLLLPVSCFLIRHLETNSRSSLIVGLYTDETDGFTESILLSLCSKTGSVRFQLFDDRTSMMEKTAANELDCSYAFEAGLHARLKDTDYKHCITCYVSPSTIADKLSEEVVFAALFRRFGEEIAVSYAEESGIFSDRQALAQISSLYQSYIEGEEVFSLNYQYLDTPAGETGQAPSAAAMPVRGFIAVSLLVGGLSGGITWLSDRERGLSVSAVCQILIPLLFLSASSCLTLFLTKEAGGWIKEITSLVVYLLLILCFVRVLLIFIKSPTALSAMIPVLALGSLVFCPIFINLGALLPFFKVLEKLFLPYYYLAFCHAAL